MANRQSARTVSKIVGIHRKTLSKYFNNHENHITTRKDTYSIPRLKYGRHNYLSEDSCEILALLCCSLDVCGFPLSLYSIREQIVKLKERELNCPVSDVPKPSRTTIFEIRKALGIPVRSARKVTSLDMVRGPKTNWKYLSHYFDKLEEFIKRYRVEAKHM